MVKRKNKTIFFLFCVLSFLSFYVKSQTVSPFNGLKINDTLKNYSFIVSGHFHGQSNNISTFPAASLLANIDTLNSIKPNFLVSLGDLFLDVNDEYINHYNKSFFNKISFPMFNVVGNHDISNGNVYEKKYGKTFFSFILNSELYIFLNTEINDGSIKGEQFDFFKQTLSVSSLDNIKNIFIFSHRPIWAERILKYEKLFLENTRTSIGKNNFTEDILPLFQNIKHKNIFWMSGSMGGGASSFFYDKNNELGITFIQTAIRDTPRDAMLKVTVNKKNVSFDGISLTGNKIEPIENYNVDFWLNSSSPENDFNYRLLPYLTKQMLLHRYFWFGFVTALLLIFMFAFIKRGRK